MSEIPVTGSPRPAIVDDEDFASLSCFRWHLHMYGYAVRTDGRGYPRRKGKKIRMHRVILSPPDGFDVDHANGDRLDNRRSNIRICTRSQNCANRPSVPGRRTEFKGVAWEGERQKWRADINVRCRHINLGRFDSEVDAALAYDAVAFANFGDFARLNFPRRKGAV